MKPEQILKMYNALKTIATNYQTPEQIHKNCKKDYGLDYEESLEMAYEKHAECG